jgi:hypothetical protein
MLNFRQYLKNTDFGGILELYVSIKQDMLKSFKKGVGGI